MTGAMWIRRRNGWLLLSVSLALLGLLGCDRFGQDTPASTPVEEEATPQPSPTRSPEPPSSPSVDRIVYVNVLKYDYWSLTAQLELQGRQIFAGQPGHCPARLRATGEVQFP